MIVIVIKNYDTGEEIGRVFTRKLSCLFDAGDIISNVQQDEDILHLGFTCSVSSTGVTSYVTKGVVMTNDPDAASTANSCHEKRDNQTAVAFGSGLSAKPPKYVKIRKDSGKVEEIPLRLLLTAYPEGYVLSVGKESFNIFGARHKEYLAGIGSRNVRFASICGCRIFPTIAKLYAFAEKNEDTLRDLVAKGYCFSVEPTCSQFAPSMDEIPTKDQKAMGKLKELLDAINESCVEEEDLAPLTGCAADREMKDEAIRRLKKLGVADSVVNAFEKHGALYVSEFGGILYYQNANSMTAVSQVRNSPSGLLPYTVICNHTTYGDIYTVLYVSRDKSNWQSERPNRSGYCLAYGYNVSDPEFSEYGVVQIQSANGGLVRVI